MGKDLMGWSGPIAGSIEDETVYHAYNMSEARAVGFFSVHVVTTGAGTLTITYELSNIPEAQDGDYVDPSATAIATSQAAGSAIYQFPQAGEVIFSKHIRLKLVATGAVIYTLYPNIQ